MTNAKIYPIATDALGNPIEMGKVYGYSQNNNGIIKVSVGIAEDIEYSGLVPFIKMRILERRSGYATTTANTIKKGYSRVKACSLFKLVDYEE